MFESLDDLEGEKPEEKDPDYTGVFIFFATIPLLIFFNYIGKFDMGLNVGICLGMNAIAVKIRCDLKKHIWFWVTIFLVVAIELPLVAGIKWPDRWVSGVSLLPIGFAGYLIAIGAIRLAEKLFVKEASSEEA
jgi:hypothetical protein